MKAYMPTVGSKGLDMMFRTCTIQVRGCVCGGGVLWGGVMQRGLQREGPGGGGEEGELDTVFCWQVE